MSLMGHFQLQIQSYLIDKNQTQVMPLNKKKEAIRMHQTIY